MPDLERVHQNTPLTLQWQPTEGGVAVDPGTVTIGITRADGSVLVAAGTATSGSGTSPRTYNLTTTHTALLDTLKVTWTGTLKGALPSYVEVVGGFLCSLDDLEAPFPSADAAERADIRTAAEERLEGACGKAFVPRFAYESKYSYRRLRLAWPNVRAVRSLSVNGIAYSQQQIETLFSPNGTFLWPYTGRLGGHVTIGYEHGEDYPGGARPQGCAAGCSRDVHNDERRSRDPSGG